MLRKRHLASCPPKYLDLLFVFEFEHIPPFLPLSDLQHPDPPVLTKTMAARYDPESAKQYQRGDEFKGSQQPVSGGMDLRQGHQQQDQQDMDPDSARQSKTTTGVLAARNDPESERRYEESHQREMSPASDPNRAEFRGEDQHHQPDHQHHEGVGSARNDPESQRRYDEAHQREMSPASDPNRAERGEASGSGAGSNRRGGGTTGNSAEDTVKKFNENENVAYGMSVFLITVRGGKT